MTPDRPIPSSENSPVACRWRRGVAGSGRIDGMTDLEGDAGVQTAVAAPLVAVVGRPFAVGGLHGGGGGELLDAILDALPDAPPETATESGPRRVVLVGRPNVGKSSLLNRLARDDRSVVDAVAGTTIDPVDSLVEL